MYRLLTLWSLFATLVYSTGPLPAADKLAAYTNPAQAGPDFLVQGEYLGTVGKAGHDKPLAAQVIALGDGKFEGVLYLGGLPGAAWDGFTRFYFRGQTEGDTTHLTGMFGERLAFADPNFQGLVRGDSFTGTADMFRNVVDDASFRMEKVERASPTLGAKPPQGAVVLFDGTHVDEWQNGKLLDGGLLDVGTESKRHFQSIQIHLEFQTPFMPTAQGMARGNSGLYVKKGWEIQIVDSFGWTAENRQFERLSLQGRCGGIHEMVTPRLNMCLPPLSWQTYDVDFEAANFDTEGTKRAPAMLSVWHNGVQIHDRYVLPPQPPGHNGPSIEHLPGPLYLQDHGNPVRFRNIWVVEKPDGS